MKFLDSPIIPYNIDERREKLSHTYTELKAYIQAHEIMKEKGYPKDDEED